MKSISKFNNNKNSLQIEIDLEMKQFTEIKNENIYNSNNNYGNWTFSKHLNIFDNAHAVLVLTEWEVYKNIKWVNVEKKMAKPAWVFGSRSIVDVDLVKESGINLWCLGDGSSKDELSYF